MGKGASDMSMIECLITCFLKRDDKLIDIEWSDELSFSKESIKLAP